MKKSYTKRIDWSHLLCFLLGICFMVFFQEPQIMIDHITEKSSGFTQVVNSGAVAGKPPPLINEVDQRRLSRLKTLHDTCRRLGYNVTTQDAFSGEELTEASTFLVIDRLNQVALNSVPKTGSTTWMYSLLNNSRLSDYKEKNKKTIDYTILHIHEHKTFKNTRIAFANEMDKSEVLRCLKTCYTVLTVRHPFDRLESTYTEKVLSYNYKKIREKILRARHIPPRTVKQLARNGDNVKFEEFLQHVMTTDDFHWLSISIMSRPCSLPYRYIAKSDTLTRDLDYVIQYKLNGHGGTPHLNAARKTVDNTHGRLLPLFSKLERQEYWISKMSEKYREDLEMFGYSYYVNERVVYATCKQYDSSHECI